MAKKLGNIISGWAFLFGVILAVVVGALVGFGIADLTSKWISISLVIIGVIIGLFNIADKESSAFLMSGVILIIASVFGAGIMSIVPGISEILSSLLMIFVPATIIVAVRNVFNLAKD